MKSIQLFTICTLLSVISLFTSQLSAQQLLTAKPTNLAVAQSITNSAERPPPQYLVLFKSQTATSHIDDWIERVQHHSTVPLIRYTVIKGFSAALPQKLVNELQQDPQLQWIERDQILTVNQWMSPATNRLIESAATYYSWGLDRLDQPQLPVDGSYQPHGHGSGVHAYIIDSGIRVDHHDFEGRASWDFTASDLSTAVDDQFGHGTHMAGIVGGAQFGVASQVHLHSIKVLDDNGQGTLSGLIEGIDFVTENFQAPAVATIGVDYGFSAILNQAVLASIDAGVVYTVPSGETGGDACQRSPASVTSAITVAASGANDQRSIYSNQGPCVDLYAPGLYIKSAWHTSDLANNTISHSPLAAAHVAGAAAIILANDENCSVSEVADKLILQAHHNVLTGVPADTHNRLLGVPSHGSSAHLTCGDLVVDADQDGIDDDLDLCPNTPIDSQIDSQVDDNGCAISQLNLVRVSVPTSINGEELAQVAIEPQPYISCDQDQAQLCGYYLSGTQVTLSAINIKPGYTVSEWQNTMCDPDLTCVVSSDVWPDVVLAISQDQAIANIPVEGGNIDYDQVANVTFYPDSFHDTHQVTVDDGTNPDWWQTFNITKQLFAADHPLDYFVVINTGHMAPQRDVSVSIHLPSTYLDAQPQHTRLAIFTALVQSSQQVVIESIEMLDSQLQVANNRINSLVPHQAFSGLPHADQQHRALLIVAAVPDDLESQQSVRGVQQSDSDLLKSLIHKSPVLHTSGLQSPGSLTLNNSPVPPTTTSHPELVQRLNQLQVQHTMEIHQHLQAQPAQALPTKTMAARISLNPQAEFNKSTNRPIFNSSHTTNTSQCTVSLGDPLPTSTGISQGFDLYQFHGINYQLDQSATFAAVRSGTIISAGEDLRYLANGQPKGWGHYVILADEQGNRFLYSHLAAGHLNQGTQVTKGDAIGETLGLFGHFEFAPAGSAKQDPSPCIEQASTGLTCTPVAMNMNYVGQIANQNEALCVAIQPEVATKFSGYISNYSPAEVDFDLSLYLYDINNGSVLALAQSATDADFELISGVLNPNWYLMVVNGRDSATGSFIIGSQGITDFDEHEYNDTAATATQLSGSQQISGSFDSASDIDWFRYEFTNTQSTARIYNHNANAIMNLVANNAVTVIPADNWITLNGEPGQGFHLVMQPNPTTNAEQQADTSHPTLATPDKSSSTPWRFTISGAAHHTGNVDWGSDEYFNVRVSYWPHVHNYYQITGNIYDASNNLIPRGMAYVSNTAVNLQSIPVLANANGYWNYRVNYANCHGVNRDYITTTDNYGRYLWRVKYDIYETNWWAVQQPNHRLSYIHMCDADVIDSAPW